MNDLDIVNFPTTKPARPGLFLTTVITMDMVATTDSRDHIEEDQMVALEEITLVVPRRKLSFEATSKFDKSYEQRCISLYGEHVLDVPTSFVVLPYEIRFDTRTNKTVAQSFEMRAAAEQIGSCLLRINKAQARLAFWREVEKCLSSGCACFRKKLKSWLRRARTEPVEFIALQMIEGIKCDKAYVGICREVLEASDIVSNARAYMANPLRAAYREIEQSTEDLLDCYKKTGRFAPRHFYLHLVDEFDGQPVQNALHIKPSLDYIRRTFIPFMNIAAMAAIESGGLLGLANLLGLHHDGSGSPLIPTSWKGERKFLVKQIGVDRRGTLEIAKLQHMVCASNEMDSSVSDEIPYQALIRLRSFFAGRGSKKAFSSLMRASDGKKAVMWTTIDHIDRLWGVPPQPSKKIENHIESLKEEFSHLHKLEEELGQLSSTLEEMELFAVNEINAKGSRKKHGDISITGPARGNGARTRNASKGARCA